MLTQFSPYVKNSSLHVERYAIRANVSEVIGKRRADVRDSGGAFGDCGGTFGDSEMPDSSIRAQ